MTVEPLKYQTIIDFFYFLLTLFSGATRLHNLPFRFVILINKLCIIFHSHRYSYRLYYCLKELQDQILIRYHPITQHILQINSSYTIYSTMSVRLSRGDLRRVCFSFLVYRNYY